MTTMTREQLVVKLAELNSVLLELLKLKSEIMFQLLMFKRQ